jgi:hypothetical protein
MNTRFISIMALAAACALPLSARAQQEAPVSPAVKPESSMRPSGPLSDPLSGKSFSAVDTNGDGFISREEAARAQGFVGRFEDLDLDRDGKLSQAEINAVAAPAAGSPASGSTITPSGAPTVPGTSVPALGERTVPGSTDQAPGMTPRGNMGTPGTSPTR